MDTNDDDRRVNKEETKGIMKYLANLVHDDKRVKKEAATEGNISDFEILCQFGSWSLDEKNIKIGKSLDGKSTLR